MKPERNKKCNEDNENTVANTSFIRTKASDNRQINMLCNFLDWL